MKQDRKLKVGVVGVGVMGREHARVYSELENAQLVGVYDQNSLLTKEISRRFRTEPFGSLSKLLSVVEAVSICTPTSDHYSTAKSALENNLAVLVEKPFTKSMKEAKTLIELANKNKSLLTVGHIERFNPIIQTIKERIKDKKVISLNISRVGPLPPRVKDVGIILDLGTHDIDLIRYISGSEFKKIFCVASKKTKSFEDAAHLIFAMNNGTIASIVTNWYTPIKVRKIEVALMEELLVGDFIAQEVTQYFGYQSDGAFTTKNLSVSKVEPLKAELGSFIECVLKGQPPLVTPQDGLIAVETALKCTLLSSKV